MDFQVKVRGFRVELGEIESRLLGHPLVDAAVVVARKDEMGDACLAAYFVPDPGALDSLTDEELCRRLRRDLASGLPGYMAPAFLVPMQSFPLTPNGKVDRRALPEPGDGAGGVIEYTAPRDEVEETLVALWGDVLKVEPDRIGIDTG
ncbi:MAG: hypothetical protein GY849_16390, partial [Deltaproteobacteria bacterium]|nr:hypothetical protein [Deltaproteobacteria bacterium]